MMPRPGENDDSPTGTHTHIHLHTQAFHEARDWAKAVSWLGEMEAEGVKPNEMTYARAMHVLSQVCT